MRNVYFSFHYKDVEDFRANVVRNSGKFRKSGDLFRDASIWEEAEEKKVSALKTLVCDELRGTSVTCVLIGTETYSRRWVRYEIAKSFELKKGQLGVGINWIKGKNGFIKLLPGENPFKYLGCKISNDGKTVELFEKENGSWIAYRDLKKIANKHFSAEQFGKDFTFSDFYKIYSYDWNSGNKNITSWIEDAAKKIGR